MRIPLHIQRIALLALLALLVLGSVVIAIQFRLPILFGIPIMVLVGLVVLYDYKPLFYLMIATVPISMMVEMGTLSIDLPSEPLMMLFLLIFLIRLFSGKQFSIKGSISIFHLLVFLLLFWTGLTALISGHPLRSLKFLLAKLWYLVAFVYMAESIIQEEKDIQKVFWAFFLPLVAASSVVTVWHAAEGFSFEASHNIPNPLFQNGVIYGACLSMFLPYAFFARKWYSPKSLEWYLISGGTAILLLGILLSYKRGPWLIVLLLPIIVGALDRKVFDKIVYASLLVALLGVGYLLKDNTFYQFAPNYEQTIFHHGNFEGHLEATFEGKELSSAERFYRWIAAKNMIAARPIMGFGPSTYNQEYKHYSDDAFRTYVSDNPEQSTTHNYFLMSFTEQGIIGGALFLVICVYMLILATHLYTHSQSPQRKNLILMAHLCLCTIIFHSLLNELIEVDKIGAFFWLNLLIIHKLYVWEKQEVNFSNP